MNRKRTGTELSCEIHGPLRHRPAGYPGNPASGYWACPGWDAGDCLNIRYGVPDESAARLLSGQTYWPGVIVR